MKHRTAATALTAVALVSALTACSGEDGTDAAPKERAPAVKSSAPAVDSSKAAAEDGSSSGIVPKPDPATQARYIRALSAVDPDLVHGDQDKAVDRGRNQCRTIHDFPKDEAKQAETAELRFTSPNHPEGFGKVKAARIVLAVRATLCPTF